MLTKCPLPYCQYPNCPTAEVNSCGRPLKDLLAEVVAERDEFLNTTRYATRDLKHILNYYQRITLSKPPDFDACPFGRTDCINNPQYQKENNYDEWAEDGYPMTCWYVENNYISAETGCDRYDDEDK